MAFPILSQEACPGCHDKPCSPIVQGQSEVVLIQRLTVPFACPLRKSQRSGMDPHKVQINTLTLQKALSVLGSPTTLSLARNLPSGVSTYEAIKSPLQSGKVELLYASFGSKEHTIIQAWRDNRQKRWVRMVEAEKALKQMEQVEEERPPALKNAVWIFRSEEKSGPIGEEEEATCDRAAVEQPVWCRVDTEELMPGDMVTFSLFRTGKDEKLTTISGRVGKKRRDNRAAVKWVVPEALRREVAEGILVELYFFARVFSKKLEVKSASLVLGQQGALGGCRLLFTNPILEVVQDVEAEVFHNGQSIHKDMCADGELWVEGLPFGDLEVRLQYQGKQKTLLPSWQSAPLTREIIALHFEEGKG